MLKEEEIRPQAIFDEYLRLTELDVKKFFDDCSRARIHCPACGGEGAFAFSKQGFEYEECPNCKTLYVNPRPSAHAFARYYQESESSRYWATTFYKATAEARRAKLWKPLAFAVKQQLERYAPQSVLVVDIGAGYGIFAEEIRALALPVVVIEPAPHLAAICREKGLEVVPRFLEEVSRDDLPEGPKAFTSFELFEHLHDPGEFLRRLRALMSAGDLFVFTTLSGVGVDIRVLWQHSKSVSPPHHLNFLNPGAVSALLQRCGFACLEVSTPGRLDMDILYNNRKHIHDRFWQVFLDQSDESDRQRMQEAMSSSGFSSHMRIACQAV
jgi:2-polyprenyl-3-methyl-5-hydroxy-6-metoxy-1,4-benzoquinol methylase